MDEQNATEETTIYFLENGRLNFIRGSNIVPPLEDDSLFIITKEQYDTQREQEISEQINQANEALIAKQAQKTALQDALINLGLDPELAKQL